MVLTLFDPTRGSNKPPVPSLLLLCCFLLLSFFIPQYDPGVVYNTKEIRGSKIKC